MSLPTDRAILDSKGRIIIPASLRRALSLKTGDVMELFIHGNNLVLRRLSPEPIKAICINCGKTEETIKGFKTNMAYKSTDGRFGICIQCDKEGFGMKEV